MIETEDERSVLAWDGPTRLFHWLLVLAILSAWVSTEYAEQLGDATLKWHRYNGYAILVLLVFRVIWGFVGPSTARWATFVRPPGSAIRYARDAFGGRDRKFLGHNPLGAYMVLALIAAVAGQATLGLMTVEHNEITWGPLYDLVSEDMQKRIHDWHTAGFYRVLLPLAAIHLLANSAYGLFKREPLIRAMVTGHKPAAAYEDAMHTAPMAATTIRAAVALTAAIALVFGTITVLGGKLFY